MRRGVPFLCAAALLLLTGCSSGSEKALPSPEPSVDLPSPSPLPTCAPPQTKPYTWPKAFPQDLPRLPGAVLGETKKTADGLTILKFSTDTSLRDSIIFIVRKLPAAGYTLGRGDAEATEADAPFTKGDLRGVLRGASTELCKTQWILAVTRARFGGTGSPLLPSNTGPSPSPLPFG